VKPELGDALRYQVHCRFNLYGVHISVVSAGAAGECVRERYGLDLVDGYGSVKEDLSPMGASIRPSLTVIDIRLKLRRAVRK
jgi:hypothetical protein